ncbi:gephyrin-like molybdotransferase receptor GlpR [Streptomyces fildesensis]|uniref:Gephyrin-like molybdotransferase receptor GlpR n=1 Tax=Streptomyces fildesensis TaxID=375757 RepID=A0ABW8CHX5_9ACTN
MSSSGLIYAVIVGAWAAYLVPMWLRRQDELNEARPTERFSTAIRLLSGRAGMERRVAKARDESDQPADAPDSAHDVVDVRGLAVPATEIKPAPAAAPAQQSAPAHHPAPAHQKAQRPGPVHNPRAKVLARRRRTTTLLFLAFTVGAIVAAVGGLAFLWAPAAPAALLTLYIGHLRRQERRRFEVKIDQRRAADAAVRLRDRPRPPAADEPDLDDEPEPATSPRTADRRALVEQTDHAEWVDQQQREQHATPDDGWDPVPVPLPTYVTAPVAPRTPGGIDFTAPGNWSSARSGTTPGHQPATPAPAATPEPEPQRELPRPTSGRRSRDRSRTPLFDQYADPDRPRAANE